MAFEGLRDRLREAWSDTNAKIQESSAFNQLREKFEEQTPVVQKLVTLGSVALVAIFLLSFPLGYLAMSRENVAQFEENRSLIQGLLRAARSAKEPSPLPPPVAVPTLRGGFERVLRENQVPPEQVAEVQQAPGIPTLAPPAVTQTGLVANIKQLNLTQIVSLANAFNNMGPGTKLIGLDVVQTAGQDHYYDINVRIVNFGLPAVAGLGGAEPPAHLGGGGPKGRAQAPRPQATEPAPEDEE